LSKLTRIERENLKQLVMECSLRRLRNDESCRYISAKLGKAISIRHIERVRKQTRQETKEWISNLANHQEDYLAEYKDRIDELKNQRRELYEIFSANAHNPEIQIKTQHVILQVTSTIVDIFTKSLLPHLPLVSSTTEMDNIQQLPPMTEELEELRKKTMEENPDFLF
jgi:phenylalanyl-tRNA synthetase alpha subunit